MSSVLRDLDERFAIGEMVAATDLQETAVGKLQERLSNQHKLLFTHYNKPFGVLLDVDVFTAMVRRLRELEAALEEENAERFIDARLTEALPAEQWLTLDQFEEAAQKALAKPPKARSRRR